MQYDDFIFSSMGNYSCAIPYRRYKHQHKKTDSVIQHAYADWRWSVSPCSGASQANLHNKLASINVELLGVVLVTGVILYLMMDCCCDLERKLNKTAMKYFLTSSPGLLDG
jgi:hypothetical protein